MVLVAQLNLLLVQDRRVRAGAELHVVQVEAGVDDRQRNSRPGRLRPVSPDSVEVPADGRCRERIGAGKVRVAGDRPVRLGETQDSLSPEPRDQALRGAAREAPDVQVGRDDRAAVRRQQPLGAGVGAEAEHRVAELPERGDLAVARHLGSRGRLRRAWRSYEEQRQEDPKTAHERTR